MARAREAEQQRRRINSSARPLRRTQQSRPEVPVPASGAFGGAGAGDVRRLKTASCPRPLRKAYISLVIRRVPQHLVTGARGLVPLA